MGMLATSLDYILLCLRQLNNTLDVNITTQKFIYYKNITDEANVYEVFSDSFQQQLLDSVNNISSILPFETLNTTLWALNASLIPQQAIFLPIGAFNDVTGNDWLLPRTLQVPNQIALFVNSTGLMGSWNGMLQEVPCFTGCACGDSESGVYPMVCCFMLPDACCESNRVHCASMLRDHEANERQLGW